MEGKDRGCSLLTDVLYCLVLRRRQFGLFQKDEVGTCDWQERVDEK